MPEDGATERTRRYEAAVEAATRAENHAEERFVGDERFTRLTLWDDGDFRVLVFHGFDTRRHGIRHAEEISYQLSDGEMVYSNFVRPYSRYENRALEEYVIEEWKPPSLRNGR